MLAGVDEETSELITGFSSGVPGGGAGGLTIFKLRM